MTETHAPFESRTSIAQRVIAEVVSELAKNGNIKGVSGFGSFWSPEINRPPHDIDLAIYCENDMTFRFQEAPVLKAALEKQFPFPVETHLLTDYTPSVGHELKNFRILLQDAVPLWGKMPTWL